MRPTGKLLAILLTLALGAPATVLAQSAGDEQYVDPFQGQEGNAGGGGGGGNDNSQGGGSDDGSTTTAQTAPTDTGDTAGETVAPESDSATLPRTGLPLLPVVLAGLFLFGAGLAVRRQTAPPGAPTFGDVSLAAIPRATTPAPAAPNRRAIPTVGLGLAGLVLLGLLRRRA